MSATVITWRLRDVMERNGIRAGDLAREMGVSANAVTNWRGVTMPRFDGDRLNQLVISLNKLRRAGAELITPSDLIGFALSPEEMKLLGVMTK